MTVPSVFPVKRQYPSFHRCFFPGDMQKSRRFPSSRREPYRPESRVNDRNRCPAVGRGRVNYHFYKPAQHCRCFGAGGVFLRVETIPVPAFANSGPLHDGDFLCRPCAAFIVVRIGDSRKRCGKGITHLSGVVCDDNRHLFPCHRSVRAEQLAAPVR